MNTTAACFAALLCLATVAHAQPIISISGGPAVPATGGGPPGSGGAFDVCPLVVVCTQRAPTTPEVAVPASSFSAGAAGAFQFTPRTVPLPGTGSVPGTTVGTIAPTTVAPGTVTPAPTPVCVECSRVNATPPPPTQSTTAVTTVPRTPGTPDPDQGDPARLTATDPVNFASGEFYLRATDLQFPGRGIAFAHVRTYRSRVDFSGDLGFGWDHRYRRRIVDTTLDVVYATGEATTIRFRKRDTALDAPRGVRLRLSRRTDGWALVDPDAGEFMQFDSAGLLTRLTDANGVGLSFFYVAGRLDRVEDAEARVIRYQYLDGRLSRVSEERSGLSASYTYAGDDLDSATDAAGRVESYRYESSPAFVADAVPEPYVPEPFLQAGCAEACASSCPNPANVAARDAWCRSQEETCRTSCRAQCPALCQSRCATTCFFRDCNRTCAQPVSAFQPACEAAADETCGFECRGERMFGLCAGKCAGVCDQRPVPRACLEIGIPAAEAGCTRDCTTCMLSGFACPSGSCNAGSTCLGTCRSLILTGRPPTGEDPCAANAFPPPPPECFTTNPPRPELPSACQETRFAWQGCAEVQKATCAERCRGADYCNTICPIEAFRAPGNECARRCRDSSCPTLCRSNESCATQAERCPDTCFSSCVERGRAARRSLRYGLPRDLVHNLIEVYRGRHDQGGELVLKNVYGPDISLPSYDAVTQQTFTGHERPVAITYDDRGRDAELLRGFVPVQICPRLTLFPGTPGVPLPARQGSGERALRVTSVSDPYGHTWHFFFGARGQLLRTVNVTTGAARSYDYDAQGRLDSLLEPLGGRTCFDYDGAGNPTTVIRLPAPGAPAAFPAIVQRFEWRALANGLFRLTSTSDPRDPARTLTRFDPDGSGNPRTTTGADGLTTTVTVDAAGRPETERRPDGSLVRYQYAAGVLAGVSVDDEGPAPVVTTLTPDVAGRPSSGVGPFGEATRWTWRPGVDRLDSLVTQNDNLTRTDLFTYDAFGRIRTTSNGQRRSTFTYDPQGFVRRIADAALDFTVPTPPEILDPDDRLSRPARVTCLRHGPDGRPLETVLPDGNRVRLRYDGEGRLTTVEAGSLGSEGPAGWDRACPTFRGARPAAGVLREVEHDRDGRPHVVRDARGAATTIDYDGYGNPITVADARGTVTRRGFDQLGMVVWTATYAPNMAPAEHRRPQPGDAGLLAASDFAYDAAGRLRTRSDWHFDKDGAPLGADGLATTTFTHDTRGRRTIVTDDAGRETVFERDGAGRPTRTTYATGGVEELRYAPGGRSVRRSTTAPTRAGRATELLQLTSWGAPSRLVRNFPPQLRLPRTVEELTGLLADVREGDLRPVLEQAWGYDAHKRNTLTRDAGGLVTTTIWDAFDRLLSQTREYEAGQPPEVVTSTWSPGGLLRARTSRIGDTRVATTTFDHDGLGRVFLTERPQGVTERRDYDGASHLVRRFVDGRGVVFRYRYDRGGLLQTLSALRLADELPGLPDDPGAGGPALDPNVLVRTCGLRGAAECQVRRFMRDGLGRVLEGATQVVRNVVGKPEIADQVVTTFEWDSLGGRTREANNIAGAVAAVTHAYDNLGQPEATTYAAETFGRIFDGVGRLTDVTQNGAAIVHFDYAALGAPTKRSLANGVVTTYGYDVLGRLERQEDVGATSLARWRWELAADGIPRVAALKRGVAAEVSSIFGVDRGGRVTNELHGVRGMDSLAIPATSPREMANALMRPMFQRPRTDGRRYTLDARHNWVERDADDDVRDVRPGIDALDAYTSFRDEPVVYDGAGSLVSVGTGESHAYDLFGAPVLVTRNGSVRRYRYDAFDRVVEETDGERSPASVIAYNWDGARRTVARHLALELTAVTIDGEALDEHLVLLQSAPSGRTRHFFHQERAASVYMLTGDDARPAELYEYTAYGETTIRGPDGAVRELSGIRNPFTFQGHPFDAALGLVSMRARLYNPEWGRFTQLDPIGLLGGSNLYAFVDSAPLRWRDPFGLAPTGPTQPAAENLGYWRRQLLRGTNVFQAGIPLDVAEALVRDYGGLTASALVDTYAREVALGAGESLVGSAQGVVTLVTDPRGVAEGVGRLLTDAATRDAVVEQVAGYLDRLAAGDPRAVGGAAAELMGAAMGGAGAAGRVGTLGRIADDVIAAGRVPTGTGARFIAREAGEILDVTRIRIPGPVNSPFGKVDYLLGNVGSVESLGKGKFFRGVLGFDETNLGSTLHRHLVENFRSATLQGSRVRVIGTMIGANGRAATVQSVWQVTPEGFVDFITAVPK